MNTRDFGMMAELAEASYALFIKQENGLTINQDSKVALTDSGFSDSQADDFLNRWEIAHHQPNTDSGFSATLFKSTDPNAAQPYVFAIRGTEPGLDDLIITDGSDIVLDGLAIDQIVDLWNYWKQLTTPEGQTFRGARLETLDEETAYLMSAKAEKMISGLNNMPAEIYLQQLYARTDIIIDNGLGYERVRKIVFDQALSGVLDAPLGIEQVFGVTGHSLGGHLAAALTRLVPGIEALSINGAGFATGLLPGLGGDAYLNVRNLFGLLDGAGSFDSTRILNLYGDKMPEFITQDLVFGLQQQGGHEPIFIEQSSFLGNIMGHGSGQMTDSLSIYRLLSVIDKNIEHALIAQLLEAASNERASSLEGMLDAIGDIFKTGDSVTVDDRESFYARLSAIYGELLVDQKAFEPELKPACQNLEIIGVNTLGASELAQIASQDTPEGIACRYALQELNPFAVVGADYSRHNANGELDLYDPETGTGTLTANWLADRAAMHQALTLRNMTDDTDIVMDGDNIVYGDKAGNLMLRYGSVFIGEMDKARILFGADSADALNGGSQSDRLYGGAGDDKLYGLGGANYLEGGAGADEYHIVSDGKADTILDIDGRGIIELDGEILRGGEAVRFAGGLIFRNSLIFNVPAAPIQLTLAGGDSRSQSMEMTS
jgi:pimeloyl-ACP methyl ester carboxylesterase